MNPSPIKKAALLIGSRHRDLHAVFIKIQRLDVLNRKIAAHLEPAIAKYTQVANEIGGKLILTVANGSIATQLRFLTADLLNQFSRDPMLKHIRSIECKVRPAPVTTTPSRLAPHAPKNMAALSLETAEIVREAAESLDDPALRNVMERIAKRVKK